MFNHRLYAVKKSSWKYLLSYHQIFSIFLSPRDCLTFSIFVFGYLRFQIYMTSCTICLTTPGSFHLYCLPGSPILSTMLRFSSLKQNNIPRIDSTLFIHFMKSRHEFVYIILAFVISEEEHAQICVWSSDFILWDLFTKVIILMHIEVFKFFLGNSIFIDQVTASFYIRSWVFYV